MVANILPAYPPLKVVMLYIKLKGWSRELHVSTYSVLTHTLNLWVGLKGKQKI